MTDSTVQVIWEGPMHMGDKPGEFPNVPYSGLSLELPVTLTRRDEGFDFDIHFRVEAENVNCQPNYRGHRVKLFAYEYIAGGEGTWGYVPAGDGLLTDGSVQIEAENPSGREHYSIRITTDGNIVPGSYDDFLITRISLISSTHSGELGFKLGFDD